MKIKEIVGLCKVIFCISKLFVQSNTASCCVHITRDIDRFLYLYQSIDPCVSCVCFCLGIVFFRVTTPIFYTTLSCKAPPATFFWNISNPPILDQPLLQQNFLVTPLSRPIFFQRYFLLLIQLKSVRKIADLGFWIS